MTTATHHLVTAEELLAMPHDQPCELIAGEIIVMTPVARQHWDVAGRISILVGSFALKNNLGILGPEGGFILAKNPDTVRAPDVAFLRRERCAESDEVYVEGPPDLAVEVVSPNDRVNEVTAKAQAWIDAGAPLVWVVWPTTRSVVVYRPGQAPRILHENDTIGGEDLLPGFECRVAEFFGQ